jgi:hypothetical protein
MAVKKHVDLEEIFVVRGGRTWKSLVRLFYSVHFFGDQVLLCFVVPYGCTTTLFFIPFFLLDHGKSTYST